MLSYFWKKYSWYLHNKGERFAFWGHIDAFRRPRPFTPVVILYVSGFYTGVISAAILEQIYKEKYWEKHPGELVPLMRPIFYYGPWRVARGKVPVYYDPWNDED